MKGRKNLRGFTLLELIFSALITGILASTMISSYHLFLKRAGTAVARQTMHDSRNALEASDTENIYFDKAVTVLQEGPGEVADAEARELLPGFRLPRKVKFFFLYRPHCYADNCQARVFYISHCSGDWGVMWERNGIGEETLWEEIASSAC